LPFKINTAGDSITRRWNVLDYLPGFVSGVTDATAGIQAAINACNAGGGGTVFFPNGTYIIGGALNSNNCQITIPKQDSMPVRLNIRLEGESVNNSSGSGGLSGGASSFVPNSGVYLKSTITTGANGAAVIAAPIGAGINFNGLEIVGLGIVVKNNPSGAGPVVGGINWKNGANCLFEKVQCLIDTSGYYSALPLYDISGIEMPDNSNGEMYSIKECFVQGFRNGYKIGEHVSIFNSNAMTCYYGFNIKDGYHSSTSTRTGIYWCAYDFYVSSGAVSPPLSMFKFDSEWQNIGKWYDNINTVKDSANRAKGLLVYTIVEASVGVNNSKFSKSGGDNLTSTTDAAFAAGILTSTGGIYSTTSTTFRNGAFELLNYNINNGALMQNVYYDGSDFRLRGTGAGGLFYFFNGEGQFRFEASGSAGAVASNVGTYATMKTNLDGSFATGPTLSGLPANYTGAQFKITGSTGAVQMSAYGAGTATFDGSGNITSSSDRRIKHAINDFKYGLAAIMKLRTRTFIYNADSSNTVMSGFIAQEVQEAIPTAVHKGNDKNGILSLETNAILAALVNGMQEQQKQIEELKAEIKQLKK